MPRLETLAFADEHLEAAAALLAERHRRHRAAEPLLPPAYEDAAAALGALEELWRAEGASGAVAARGGEPVAFVVGVPKDDATWGPNVWVENAGHAASEPEALRDAYGYAAARWVDEARVRHYALVPATDAALVDAWFRLSFGAQHAYGIREVPADAAWPAGVRRARPADGDALVELTPLLTDHQDASPVFARVSRNEDDAELRREILDDLGNPRIGDLVAERDGRIVGSFQNVPVELSSVHSALARPERAALLAWAATRADVRGSGAGIALTDATLAWAREQGYETLVTDWRETNLLSSRFWPRRGFRRTFLRLYRHVP